MFTLVGLSPSHRKVPNLYEYPIRSRVLDLTN